MKKRLALIVLVLLCFLIQPVAEAKLRRSDYTRSLRKWTRSQELYQRDDFYASLRWSMTLFSDDFIHSLVSEVGRTYNYSESEKQDYLNKQLKQHSGSTSFFLSFYTYEQGASDLTAKKKLWKIRLIADGQVFEPKKIEKVAAPSALHKALFPYIRVWSDHFYVYFPEVDLKNAKEFRLTIHGPFAKGKLDWSRFFKKHYR